jgi:cysteine desulfurase
MTSKISSKQIVHSITSSKKQSTKKEQSKKDLEKKTDSKIKEIYMDNAATTRVDYDVVSAMLPFYKEFYGNPSSIHSLGLFSQKEIEKSREYIAKSINAEKDEIFFTSGATESINFALVSYARSNKYKGNHIISTKIEHDAVLSSLDILKDEGFEITLLDIDEDGFIDIEKLKKSITDKTIIVSIIHANNEIGTIQDIETIGKICKDNCKNNSKDKDIFFHTDTTQSYTKSIIDVKKQNISSCSISAHKFHGPKGVGVVYIKKGTKIKPYLFGGHQENGMRSGTQNVPGIVGMAKAAEIAFNDYDKNISHLRTLQDYLFKKILLIPNTYVNGPSGRNIDKRLCNNVNVSFDFIEGEAMLLYLDMEGVKCSTGSACSSNSLKPSHVLAALNVPFERMHGTLRFSVSKYTTIEDCDIVYEKLKKVVERLRAMSPLTKK